MCLWPNCRSMAFLLKVSGIAGGKAPASLLDLTSSLADLHGVLWYRVILLQSNGVNLEADASSPISPVMTFIRARRRF